VDTRLVLIKNGWKVFGKDYEKCWSESLEFMRNICRDAKKRGLILILEMEPLLYSLTNSVATSQRYLRDLGVDNFLMNIDIGHFFIVKNGPEEIKTLSGSIAHVHVSDNNGLNDINDVLGTGMVPISDYINACIESGIEDTCQRNNVLPVAAMEIGSFRRPVYQPRNEVKMPLEFLRENLSFLELK
jgi:sugar phosphate isomerase/epimerase